MAEPFLGEIKIVGFNFAPRGWAKCEGQLLPISQNTALFSLLGTMYGGDGRTTFGLPDMRGRVGVGQGQGAGLSPYILGQELGQESHTLALAEMPAHTHEMAVSDQQATTSDPRNGVFAKPNVNPRMQNLYGGPATVDMEGDMIGATGNSESHQNRQPYLAVLFAIALQGVYPSRN